MQLTRHPALHLSDPWQSLRPGRVAVALQLADVSHACEAIRAQAKRPHPQSWQSVTTYADACVAKRAYTPVLASLSCRLAGRPVAHSPFVLTQRLSLCLESAELKHGRQRERRRARGAMSTASVKGWQRPFDRDVAAKLHATPLRLSAALTTQYVSSERCERVSSETCRKSCQTANFADGSGLVPI